MQKPFLSICIPTYNRAGYVTKTLDSITGQIQDENIDQIEIVVVDDGSRDNTAEEVKKYQAEHPHNIRFSRNEANLGFDRNLINTINLASGKYCWFVGDDDLLRPGAIKTVLSEIEDKDNAFVVLNFSRLNNNTGEIVIDKMIELGSKKFADGNEFFFTSTPLSKFSILGKNLIYISILIFRRDHWQKHSRDFHQYLGVNFIHTFITLKILLSDKPEIIYIGEPYVIYRSENARDWGNNYWQDFHNKLIGEGKKFGLDKKRAILLQTKYFLVQLKTRYLGPIKKKVFKLMGHK